MDRDDLDRPAEPEEFGVLPENWQSLLIFLKCSSQWEIVAGMGGCFYQGLKSERVDTVLNRSGLSTEEQNKIFDDLLLIEQGATPVLNEKS